MPVCNRCRFYAKSGIGAQHCSKTGKLMNPKCVACDLYCPRAKMAKLDLNIKTLNGHVAAESTLKDVVKFRLPALEPTVKEDDPQ